MMTADQWGAAHDGAATFARFHAGDAQQAALAAAFADRLIAIGFGPEHAAAMFGVAELSDVRSPRVAYYDRFVLPHTAAGRAARFFVLHEPEPDADLRAWLGAELVDFLAAMAAIRRDGAGWRSIVSVTWFEGKLIVADARAINVVWPESDEPFADLVMPPGGDSIGLARTAPRSPRRLTLDLCCGAGAQTLVAATYSERAIGVDLNPRALRFAAFNAAANRASNVRFLHGDTYAPLGAERFDAILANPPFVPWPEDGAALLYRGGGPRGEDVLERILRGAVERLEPHGTLAIVADFADTAQLPERITAWQGGARGTLLVLQRPYDLLEYAEMHSAHVDDGDARRALANRLMAHFLDAGIRTLDFGYLIQTGAPGPAHTVRSAAVRSGAIHATVEEWFAHQARIATADLDRTPLMPAPGVQLLLALTRRGDGTQAEAYFLVPEPATLLAGREVAAPVFVQLDRCTTGDVCLGDVADPQVAQIMRELLAAGYLRLR